MKKALVVTAVLFMAFVFVHELSQAQESDISQAWLIGTWTGGWPSPGGYGVDDRVEIVFADGGKFSGDLQSRRSSFMIYFNNGKFLISDGKVMLEGIYKGGPGFVNGTKFTAVLQRDGDTLVGTWFGSRAYDVTFRKDKKK